MLHYLDDLDSKMESMRAHFEREAEAGSSWTTYNPSLGRMLLNTSKFLKGEKEEAAAAAAAGDPTSASGAAEVESPSESAAAAEEKV